MARFEADHDFDRRHVGESRRVESALSTLVHLPDSLDPAFPRPQAGGLVAHIHRLARMHFGCQVLLDFRTHQPRSLGAELDRADSRRGGVTAI